MKVLVLGSKACGKSTLLESFHCKKYKNDVYALQDKENKLVFIEINDIDNYQQEEEFDELFNDKINCVMLCYDISDIESYKYITKFLYPLALSYLPEAYMLVIGLKSDLNSQREVSIDELESFTNNNDGYFMEISAMNNVNVELTLNILKIRANHIVNNNYNSILLNNSILNQSYVSESSLNSPPPPPPPPPQIEQTKEDEEEKQQQPSFYKNTIPPMSTASKKRFIPVDLTNSREDEVDNFIEQEQLRLQEQFGVDDNDDQEESFQQHDDSLIQEYEEINKLFNENENTSTTNSTVSNNRNRLPSVQYSLSGEDTDTYDILVDINDGNRIIGTIPVNIRDSPSKLARKFVHKHQINSEHVQPLSDLISQRISDYKRENLKKSNSSRRKKRSPVKRRGNRMIIGKITVAYARNKETTITVREEDDALEIVNNFKRTYGYSARDSYDYLLSEILRIQKIFNSNKNHANSNTTTTPMKKSSIATKQQLTPHQKKLLMKTLKLDSAVKSSIGGGSSPNKKRLPLFHLTVNISKGNTDKIDYYEGDDPEELVNDFCVYHHLNPQTKGRKLLDLLLDSKEKFYLKQRERSFR